MLDQLAGALDSLNLRKEERRKKKLDLRKDQAVSRDQSSPEERSKEFMVEMFRKSIQDIGGETTLKQGGSQSSSQNMRPGMKSWGKVDFLNSSLGSARSRGSEGSSMSSGRVKKTTTSNGQRKGDVEVLRFLSLRLVSLYYVLVALGLLLLVATLYLTLFFSRREASSTYVPCLDVSSPPTGKAWMLAG